MKTIEPTTQPIKWISVKNKKSNPEGIINCPKCKKDIFQHPEYFKHDIITCSKCNKISDLTESMVKLRGWSFVKIERKKYTYRVHVTCTNNHPMKLIYKTLKYGG